MDDSESPLPIGEPVIAGYRVIELLQRGRDFDTYSVWSEERYASCVLKTVRPDRVPAKSCRSRLLNEARIVTTLNHPHLVRGYEMRSFPSPALITETLAGATLASTLEARGRLTAPDIAHLGNQLASALRYLHAHGVLHLDVKPSNVIVGGGLATLLDLSLAQPPGRCTAGAGTPDYLSPEQAHGGHVDSPADVWGLGICLYECATRINPFRPRPTDGAAASLDPCSTCGTRRRYLQLFRRPAPVADVRRLPATLRIAIDAALACAPEDRPTLADMQAAFADLVGASEPLPANPVRLDDAVHHAEVTPRRKTT